MRAPSWIYPLFALFPYGTTWDDAGREAEICRDKAFLAPNAPKYQLSEWPWASAMSISDDFGRMLFFTTRTAYEPIRSTTSCNTTCHSNLTSSFSVRVLRRMTYVWSTYSYCDVRVWGC
ncbi:hypothetical protein QBC46DRAFT_401935 [Diplogelasinospora grovesii]|uniref:Uncharacterized protein n=1 Tax=Diplogelasinospora grovesii TaxID=303347 RepID=A0AAN6MU54_9PEZI|nr:hypothetical protein QBC46DRAFT_401935 [Diplogelasinospora grovesii]